MRAWSHTNTRRAEIRLLRLHRTSIDFIWRHYQTASDLDCTHNILYVSQAINLINTESSFKKFEIAIWNKFSVTR